MTQQKADSRYSHGALNTRCCLQEQVPARATLQAGNMPEVPQGTPWATDPPCSWHPRSVTRSYYRNSAGGMLLFDLTNRASFESVRRWHREVTDTIQPFRMVFLLVGHKSDLAGQRRVGHREAEKLAASLGAQYVETSAKDASNVVQAFQMLTVAIYQALQKGRLVATEAWDGVKSRVPLQVPPKAQALEEEKRKRCSC